MLQAKEALGRACRSFLSSARSSLSAAGAASALPPLSSRLPLLVAGGCAAGRASAAGRDAAPSLRLRKDQTDLNSDAAPAQHTSERALQRRCTRARLQPLQEVGKFASTCAT